MDQAAHNKIVIATDRRILDQQIRDTIQRFAPVGATVGHAERSGDLRRFIVSGKKIIITTVQKFPFILDEIGSEHQGHYFAIVIDEAHSSQAFKRVITPLFKDDTEFFKQVFQNDSFRRFVTDMVVTLPNQPPAP